MAELEIVDPGPSYEVVSDAERLWILPELWKTPGRPRSIAASPWRFPQLLGRATPAHRLHSLDNNRSLEAKVMYDARHSTR